MLFVRIPISFFYNVHVHFYNCSYDTLIRLYLLANVLIGRRRLYYAKANRERQIQTFIHVCCIQLNKLSVIAWRQKRNYIKQIDLTKYILMSELKQTFRKR